MHLYALNLPDLLLSLWRGTMPCDPDDDKATWDWAVLTGDRWDQHGAVVESITKYLPGCFDKPPGNPAEKLNSGYKAQEYMTYLYVLCPALLRDILPEKYWVHFCKLARAVRLIWERLANLLEAHTLLLQVENEFELLYYQRKSSRLHFCRQSMHALVHTVPEIVRTGPGGYRSQWTMERTIGNLGEEIKQHSNPYANLSQRGKRRCQLNALKVLIPTLEPEKGLPENSVDLGNGYILLRARDEYHQLIEGAYGEAIRDYLAEAEGVPAAEGWMPRVARWARMRLPNKQIVRSVWKESTMPKVRISRNIKSEDGEILYGEVQFFFQATILDKEETLALISIYSPPNAALLAKSFHTVAECDYFGEDNLRVIKATQIQAGIGMIPIGNHGKYFVAEKLGLDILSMGGAEDEMDE
ncbi:hypothetical protein DFH08DRAFT_721220 [Mycena albidolilacea]|uniref:Uncharacterized protein n=1 Tax=Mycena albidolilacea TaxID=1033008 RepID=A0AAD6Z3U9_9AGAR|nr:hypothetical protein DFH08DRAFT_721220 [Mycena albidolilacea]